MESTVHLSLSKAHFPPSPSFDTSDGPDEVHRTDSFLVNKAILSAGNVPNPPSSYGAPFLNLDIPVTSGSTSFDSLSIHNSQAHTVSPVQLHQETFQSALKLGNTDVYLGDRSLFTSKRLTSQRVQQLAVDRTSERYREDSNAASPTSSTASDSHSTESPSPTSFNPLSLTTLFNTPFTPTIPPELQEDHAAVLRLFLRPHVSVSEYKPVLKPFYVNTKKIRIINGEERMLTFKKCLLCNHALDHAMQIYQHLLEHFGIYPFRCNHPSCKFSSTRSADLWKHVKEQHEPNPGHKCSKCGAVIRHQRNLKRHWKRHHASSC